MEYTNTESSFENNIKIVQVKKLPKDVKRYNLEIRVVSLIRLFIPAAREISGTSNVKNDDIKVRGKIIKGITIP